MNELVAAALAWYLSAGAPVEMPDRALPTMDYCRVTPGSIATYYICLSRGIWPEGKVGFAVVIHEVGHYLYGPDHSLIDPWVAKYLREQGASEAVVRAMTVRQEPSR